MARRRNKGEERHIAVTRVRTLLGLARQEALGPDADLADRYASLARRVAMRYQLPLRRADKTQVCRDCGAYRVPGRNTRVRIQSGRIITTCLACGAIRRRPIQARRPRANRRASDSQASHQAMSPASTPPSPRNPTSRSP
jgi:ribonuclease P protein subunit RPR2